LYRITQSHRDLLGYSLIVAVIAFQMMQKGVTLTWPDNSVAIGVFRGAFYAYVGLALPFLFRATAMFDFDRRIGDLSYPLYLIHFPIIELLSTLELAGGSPEMRSLVVFALSLGASWLIVAFVDEPIARFRSRVFRVESRPALVSVAVGGRT
jgi:peptidoglycan/LPS O-acetylase OafA/YrhL